MTRVPALVLAVVVATWSPAWADEEPQHMPPSQADNYFTGGLGPPVYSSPSYTFGQPDWPKCGLMDTSPGVYEWDGCDPFPEDADADYFHYDKPYGRSPGDAWAFLLWEPGRFERAGYTLYGSRGYFQSDRWRGLWSGDDGGFYDPATRCGGYYWKNHRVWVPGQDVPLPLPFPVSTPEVEKPLPGSDQGRGLRVCHP